ncbi:MAG: hut operon positive regulator HutP [Ruminococcaceae bacterium]|nr:hut operon positive regulator HutP [Oscillospiraceae bacterium]
MQEKGSRTVAAAALKMVAAEERAEEVLLKEHLLKNDIKASATDFGGDFIASVSKVIERALLLAKRDGIINDSHAEEGGVAGAARDAMSQITQKAMGLNIGGKIAVARSGEHIAVAVFFGVGMLNLNEVAVGLGHRAVFNV